MLIPVPFSMVAFFITDWRWPKRHRISHVCWRGKLRQKSNTNVHIFTVVWFCRNILLRWTEVIKSLRLFGRPSILGNQSWITNPIFILVTFFAIVLLSEIKWNSEFWDSFWCRLFCKVVFIITDWRPTWFSIGWTGKLMQKAINGIDTRFNETIHQSLFENWNVSIARALWQAWNIRLTETNSIFILVPFVNSCIHYHGLAMAKVTQNCPRLLKR